MWQLGCLAGSLFGLEVPSIFCVAIYVADVTGPANGMHEFTAKMGMRHVSFQRISMQHEKK